MQNLTYAQRYALYGAAFGFAFPVFSTLLDASIQSRSLIEAQIANPLLWVINSAPIFLGIFASIAGRRQDALEGSLTELKTAHAKLESTFQRLRQQSEDLAVALEAKSQFMAKMSHELRTPLNVINGFTRLIIERGSDKLDARPKRHLNMVLEAGDQLLRLVNDILDLERIESGRLSIENVRMDLGELLRGTHEAMFPQAEEVSLPFSLTLPEETIWVSSDPTRLRQVVSNIVTNSIKYAQEGTISLKLEPQSAGVKIVIEDTGVGMPADQLDRVFQPFQQLDNSTTRSRDGAGLGLSIVRKLTELLGGKVTLESELGKGTTFTIFLPEDMVLERQAQKTEAPAINEGEPKDSSETAAPASAPTAGRRVLIIDDKKELLELLQQQLEEADFVTTSASSGKAGLAAAISNPPDVILLDIIMPGMDGWEVLRRLREEKSTRDIPVVISSMLEDSPRATDLDIAAWITKPLDMDLFRRTVSEALVGDNPNVLIVEDDEGTRTLLREAMHEQGLTVREAATGGAAVDAIDKRLPDAIILDLSLPGLSGFDVLGQLRKRPDGHKPRVIVYTAADLTDEQKAQLRDGLATVVEKHATEGLQSVVDIVSGAANKQIS